jgi:hypothetical protein
VRQFPCSVSFSQLLMPAIDVGNGWESRTHYCQPNVVSFIALLCYVVPLVLLGRVLLKLFPELRLHITFLSRYVRSFLHPDAFNDFA